MTKPSVSLESSATAGKCPDHKSGRVGVADGMEDERLVTGTPIHGGRQHIEHERGAVHSVSNCAMVLDAAGVLLEPR